MSHYIRVVKHLAVVHYQYQELHVALA